MEKETHEQPLPERLKIEETLRTANLLLESALFFMDHLPIHYNRFRQSQLPVADSPTVGQTQVELWNDTQSVWSAEGMIAQAAAVSPPDSFLDDRNARFRMGAYVFSALTSEEAATKRVEFIPNRRGITIVCHPNDFKKFSLKPMARGFYERKKIPENSKSTTPTIIVQSGPESDMRITHEEFHSVMDAFQSALLATGTYETVWGGKRTIPMESCQTGDRFLSYVQKEMVPFALARMKDEIITVYNTMSLLPNASFFTTRHGAYDYFDDIVKDLAKKKLLPLGEEQAHNLINMMWEAYTQKVTKILQDITTLHDLLDTAPSWSRLLTFGFLLALMPNIAGETDTTVYDTFVEEARSFQKVLKRAQEVHQHIHLIRLMLQSEALRPLRMSLHGTLTQTREQLKQWFYDAQKEGSQAEFSFTLGVLPRNSFYRVIPTLERIIERGTMHINELSRLCPDLITTAMSADLEIIGDGFYANYGKEALYKILEQRERDSSE